MEAALRNIASLSDTGSTVTMATAPLAHLRSEPTCIQRSYPRSLNKLLKLAAHGPVATHLVFLPMLALAASDSQEPVQRLGTRQLSSHHTSLPNHSRPSDSDVPIPDHQTQKDASSMFAEK